MCDASSMRGPIRTSSYLVLAPDRRIQPCKSRTSRIRSFLPIIIPFCCATIPMLGLKGLSRCNQTWIHTTRHARRCHVVTHASRSTDAQLSWVAPENRDQVLRILEVAERATKRRVHASPCSPHCMHDAWVHGACNQPRRSLHACGCTR